MKGKPWPADDERKLKDWFKSGIRDLGVLTFSLDGKYSRNAIYQKLLDLGLVSKEEEARKNKPSSSTTLKLPPDLPSIEEALKILAATLKALDQPGLDQGETLRLRTIIQGVKVYKELFADYVDYRGLEAELSDLREKYEGLAKKAQGVSCK